MPCHKLASLSSQNGFVGLNGQRSGLPVMTSAPTIVFGADVHHAAPNSTQPSYAAIVASLDKTCTKFHTVVNRQGSRNEVSLTLQEVMRSCQTSADVSTLKASMSCVSHSWRR